MHNSVLEAVNYAKPWLGQGKLASYIPQLKAANPQHLAVAITDLEGNLFAAGDSKVPFSIQSIVKIILLATALDDVGFEYLFARVGMEPSGDPFHSILRLESMTGMPMNPMINAGAIAVTSCISGTDAEQRFSKVCQTAAKLLHCQNLDYDRAIFQSEWDTGDKNRALAYMMRSSNILTGNVDDHLSIYFKACSLIVNCEQISYLAALIAKDGLCPINNQRLIDSYTIKIIRSLMVTCGMYDASGEFALRVGIPAKSGVGGGILATVPKRMGIGVFAPALDLKGNSLCGIKALEYLSDKHDLHIL